MNTTAQPRRKDENGMKKQYEAPEIEILPIGTPDMLIGSGNDDETDWGVIHWF